MVDLKEFEKLDKKTTEQIKKRIKELKNYEVYVALDECKIYKKDNVVAIKTKYETIYNKLNKESSKEILNSVVNNELKGDYSLEIECRTNKTNERDNEKNSKINITETKENIKKSLEVEHIEHFDRNVLKAKLNSLRYIEGYIGSTICNKEELKKYSGRLSYELPDNIRLSYTHSAYGIPYKYDKLTISEDELKELIEYSKLKELRTIRKCIVFFTILTIIGLICGLISILLYLSEV